MSVMGMKPQAYTVQNLHNLFGLGLLTDGLTDTHFTLKNKETCKHVLL